MKKLFFMLICLFLLYLGIQFAFTIFSKGEKSDYILKNDNIEFSISEQSYFSNNIDNYEYVINAKDNKFYFQVNHDFRKLKHVIEKIEYFNDEKYECILPIFKNNLILTDLMCYNNGNLNYYYNLKGKNKNLDNFVSNLKTYNINNFTNSNESEKLEGIFVYKNNLISDHYITITNYKGIYDVSSNFNSVVYNVSLFMKDIYNQKISAFVDEYYVVADYDEEYEFNKFKVFNLIKLDDSKIISDNKISFDSYVQGVVDGKLYIYDKDSKTQYEINVKKGTIVTYSGNNIKYYKDGNWTTMTIKEANEELKFTENKVDFNDSNYARIDKVGDKVGYYYLYKKNGNNYDVYRRSINNSESLIYLFSTKTIDSIQYVDNYVYFVNGNMLQFFKDDRGVQNVIQFKELEFNKKFKLYIYSK